MKRKGLKIHQNAFKNSKNHIKKPFCYFCSSFIAHFLQSISF